ncbi:MAG: AAA family ATPase [Candidatus Marinimicrobia bacterium]|nr:AAA family ATPase [Candidatus Neomarinimicrobiota bacterium]
MKAEDDLKLARELRESRDALMVELRKVIIGQEEVIEQVLLALFARGHCLLVGVPGLAKTLLVSSLASILDLRFRRIQFTPDLMPSDITGTRIIEEDADTGRRDFRFVKGPIFANMVLADEINRTPPKTQAALLEAMQEKRVTVAGITYELDLPFLVLATQNPIEQEGTYPLPEAQLDRFMFSLNITYPSRKDEIEIVKSTTSGPDKSLKSTITKDDILTFQSLVRRVPVADNVVEFAVDLAAKTRPEDGAPQFISDWLEWGAGPRASQYLILGSKAKAILDGRPTPDISDVIAMAKPVLRHRIITSFNAEADGVNADQVLDQLIQKSA